MLKTNSRRISYLSRQKYVPPEIDNIFQLVIHEKYKDLSNYILDKKNEIWKIKKGDDITILHSSCVLDNFKLVKLIIESTKTVPLRVFVTLNQDSRQPVGRQVHQLLAQVVVAVVHIAALLHEVPSNLRVLQQLLQDVLHIVHLGPSLQHTAEIVVLRIDYGLVEDVAVQGVGGVERRHALNLHAGAVQQHRTQAACLRGHIYLTWVDILVTHNILHIQTQHLAPTGRNAVKMQIYK